MIPGQTQILGYEDGCTPEQEQAARITTALHCTDADDLRDLLDALGLAEGKGGRRRG